MKKNYLLIAAAIFAAACTPDPVNPDPTPEGDLRHALVLCEGGWGNNDASLAQVGLGGGTVVTDWFAANNGRGLGDVAQDLVVYGSKAYVTVTFSNSLEVIDTATGQSVRHDMGTLTPRYIAAADGHLYVSCYTGRQVVAFDTANLDTPLATYQMGDYQPEGVAVAGGRLFAASSWISGQNQSYSYDSCVYVFDLASGTLLSKVTVGLNPQMAVALSDGRVAVNYSGDYGSAVAGCAIIDATTLTVTQLGRPATGMTAHGQSLYAYSRSGYGASSTSTYWCYDGQTVAELPITVGNAYGISVDGHTGNLLVCTDGNYNAAGDVMCFKPDGTRLWKCEAGMLPRKVVPLAQ